jgi:hypothetical protein
MFIGDFGERGRNRTYNLLIKSQLLCQLSYAPTANGGVRTNSNYIILVVRSLRLRAACGSVAMPASRDLQRCSRDYADAASRFGSGTAGVELGLALRTGLRIGTTSAGTGGRRSTRPIIGRSEAPAETMVTKRFSAHKRSINRRCQGRRTCCGSEKKFRNVQIRYARSTRFGCT